MTDLKALVTEASGRLVTSDAPDVDAYEILRKVTGFSRHDILIEPVRDMSEEEKALFCSLVEKRATGYPLQYILGEWDFYGNTFFVNEGVLIPRNETEQIADEACRFLKNKEKKVVFDLCSGSGCIGLSVAVNNPRCEVFLFDVSPEAVECSRRNTDNLSLDNVKIFDYDIFHGFEKTGLPRPDVILSNPPYVTREEFMTLQTEIFYEPERAIVCEGDGLDFYRCICEKWLPYLNDGGFFMLESGEEQPLQIVDIMKNSKAFSIDKYNVMCCDDMYGVCRFVKGG
ncbi:MAG: peptide chain release factor N(5)-glutamine methyltransferase [Clostridia bacterium]|nr:peptide chain release factor N(5)-glutamine methyltransferase [Clostridia bacterium]MBQ8503477.1 peptide chain release factor N(5)-glutamine methyltransferase [Clostridia bacterium]